MRHSLFILLFCLSCSLAKGQSMRAFFLDELLHHPASQIEDLYKLAYQAAMGNAHFVKDSATVLATVEQELAQLDTTSAGPLITPIAPGNRIVRLHLRAARKAGISPQQLCSAMLETASIIQPSLPLLQSYLTELEKLADDALLPFSYEKVQAYLLEMKRLQFPPVHHSKQYTEAYSPAYYILAGECLATYFKGIPYDFFTSPQ